jgi:purine-binding chemotaxis protein CheW
MNTSVNTSYILGIGCIKSGDRERMLILTDIEALMGRAEMGLMETAPH